jgi:putative endonuclease
MHSVYILYSPSIDTYYVGQSVNAHYRTFQHNQHFYPRASTIKASDWQIKIQFEVPGRKEALVVESYIKSMKSKTFLNKLIADETFRLGFVNLIQSEFGIAVKV